VRYGASSSALAHGNCLGICEKFGEGTDSLTVAVRLRDTGGIAVLGVNKVHAIPDVFVLRVLVRWGRAWIAALDKGVTLILS